MAACSASSNLIAADSNDNFNSAPHLIATGDILVVNGSTAEATLEANEPAQANIESSVWFRWEPAYSFHPNFEILIGTPSIALFEGSSLENLVQTPHSSTNPAAVAGNRTYYLRVAGVLNASGPFLFRIHPPPANDNFAAATDLPGTSSTNIFRMWSAGPEPGEPVTDPAFRRTIWYHWNSAAAGEFWPTVFPFGTNTVSNLGDLFRIEAFRGNTLTNLVLQAKEGGFFRFHANQDYFIRFSSGETPLPPLVFSPWFNVVPGGSTNNPGLPENDNIASATLLTGTAPNLIASNSGATLEPGETKPTPESGGRTIWYQWIAPFDGTASVGFTQQDAVFAQAYKRDPQGALQPLSLRFVIKRGERYYLQFDSTAAGPTQFSFNFFTVEAAPVANDDFAQARRVLSDNTHYEFTTITMATSEPGEPAPLAGRFKSVWWVWQPPRTQLAQVLSYGRQFTNTTVSVYTGTSLTSLKLLARDFDRVAIGLKPGETYWFSVSVPEDTTGDLEFRIYGYGHAEVDPVYALDSTAGSLVQNGNFLNGLQGWQTSGSIEVIPGYMKTWPRLGPGASLFQEFQTVPGRLYSIRFDSRSINGREPVDVRLDWNREQIGSVWTPTLAPWAWKRTNFFARATSEVSTVKLTMAVGPAYLDAIRVSWAEEPPSIIDEPDATLAVHGGRAAFAVLAQGVEPLNYYWYHRETLLPEKDERVLVLEDVQPGQEGAYSVIVSNRFGIATSRSASLLVEQQTAPVILVQPEGRHVPEGTYFSLSVLAAGTPPLRYQWFFNEQELAETNGTNAQIVFPSFTPANSGTYKVKVSGPESAVLSLPATITGITTNAHVPLTIGYISHDVVYDVNSYTPLNGRFLAQVYIGADEQSLVPVGTPRAFQNRDMAGHLPILDRMVVPHLAEGSSAFAQLRVWEEAYGPSYEFARAAGSKIGRSTVRPLTWNSVLNYNMLQTEPFQLQTGFPKFNTGLLEAIEDQQDGTALWRFRAEPGFRYLIEKSGADFSWAPFMVLTNSAGTIQFSTPAHGTREFFRARILE